MSEIKLQIARLGFYFYNKSIYLHTFNFRTSEFAKKFKIEDFDDSW